VLRHPHRHVNGKEPPESRALQMRNAGFRPLRLSARIRARTTARVKPKVELPHASSH
jgi:hypothetical protein